VPDSDSHRRPSLGIGRCGSPRRAAQTLNPTLPTNHAGMAAETAENDSSQETPPLAATAGVAGGPNPCCAKLWKKYQQIEKGRAVLREAVKLLNSEIDKVRNEKSALAEGTEFSSSFMLC
uniref:Uncharacterized protein n=1 Tax=Aegilops tauschii subsp. strangulata TaxID=200361 RepID=A0A453FLD4_AEGTS